MAVRVDPSLSHTYIPEITHIPEIVHPHVYNLSSRREEYVANDSSVSRIRVSSLGCSLNASTISHMQDGKKTLQMAVRVDPGNEQAKKALAALGSATPLRAPTSSEL
jgi:hypothetical protein